MVSGELILFSFVCCFFRNLARRSFLFLALFFSVAKRHFSAGARTRMVRELELIADSSGNNRIR
jgi:hypothetical protein